MTSPGQGKNKLRIGEALVEDGTLTQEQLDDALTQQQHTGEMLGKLLLEQGLVTNASLVGVLARRLGVRSCILRHGLVDPALLKIIGEDEALRLRAIPIFKVRNTMTVVMAEPQSLPTIDRLRKISGCKIRPLLGMEDKIR
ncbi:MAG: hypothetical protein OER86_08380, partial [Phycisphaerae bacterium]|nr:hypothetical protein [Phycisphaerae bacterium]